MGAKISRNLPRRGRPFGWRKPPLAPRVPAAAQTYALPRWCSDADVSRTWVYARWAVGAGPRHVRVGGRVVVTESPREFFERMAATQLA